MPVPTTSKLRCANESLLTIWNVALAAPLVDGRYVMLTFTSAPGAIVMGKAGAGSSEKSELPDARVIAEI